MTKVVAILCDYCKRHMGEFVYKEGDVMNNPDICKLCEARRNG